MIDPRTAPYAATALRVALGILFLAHAGLKLFVFTPAGTVQFLGSLGLPGPLAFFTNPNGGWEFLALWIVGLVAVALLGDGACALKPTPAATRPALAR